jgi:transcriptional regulator with XRE-family HTH domain
MNFGAVLRHYRLRAGLTQRQLAERAGVPVRSVENWEINHRVPRMPTTVALARALGVSVDEMMACKLPAAPKKPARRRKGGE